MNILKRLGDFLVPSARNNYTPHAIGHRHLSLYAGLMVSVKLVSLFSLDLLPQNKAFSSAVTPTNILELTNYSRAGYRLAPLKMNGELSQAAQAKAEDMAKNQYFAHVSPGGKTPWDFIKTSGYNYLIAGENLAINFYDSESLENAWMNSPGHKANILNSGFEDIGIGVVQGMYKGAKATFVVQMFGATADQNYTAQFAYSHPQSFVEVPRVTVPAPLALALPTPILAGSDFALTNSINYQIHGYAPNADAVYVVVNDSPQVKLDVIDGEYKGSIVLREGANNIKALSFNAQGFASQLSKNITVRLDSTAPVVQTDITQTTSDGQKEYVIKVQASSDAAKVIASIGSEKLFLQPSSDPNVWEGKVSADVSEVQGGINVRAIDLAGNVGNSIAGTFSPNLSGSYGFLAQDNKQVSVFNKTLPLNSVNNLYIYFALFLMIALAAAIAVKKEVQHLGMIAHTSAIVAVAIVLWIT